MDQLLSLLKKGGVHTPGELAARLGVTESLVDQMLADLSRMGYLRPASGLTCQTSPPHKSSLGNGSSAHCAECPLVSDCAAGGPGGRVWTLTDKAFQSPGRA